MKRHSGKLRIVSGKHKGRNIYFPATDELRPTAERIRETLFNWLANHIEGSVCLDLFAGSGALGLEAISRGAEEVVFVESNLEAAKALKENVATIGLESKVVCQNAVSYLKACNQKFDIVFLDPPYRSDLMEKSIEQLIKSKVMNQLSWVYAEYSIHTNPPATPENWLLHRTTKAGDAKASLYNMQ